MPPSKTDACDWGSACSGGGGGGTLIAGRGAVTTTLLVVTAPFSTLGVVVEVGVAVVTLAIALAG